MTRILTLLLILAPGVAWCAEPQHSMSDWKLAPITGMPPQDGPTELAYISCNPACSKIVEQFPTQAACLDREDKLRDADGRPPLSMACFPLKGP